MSREGTSGPLGNGILGRFKYTAGNHGWKYYVLPSCHGGKNTSEALEYLYH